MSWLPSTAAISPQCRPHSHHAARPALVDPCPFQIGCACWCHWDRDEADRMTAEEIRELLVGRMVREVAAGG